MATTKRPATTRSSSNEDRVQGLLLWARRNLFMVQHVAVGDVSVSITDLRPTMPAEAKGTKPPRTVHDAYADDYGLPRPSDAPTPDDEDGEP